MRKSAMDGTDREVERQAMIDSMGPLDCVLCTVCGGWKTEPPDNMPLYRCGTLGPCDAVDDDLRSYPSGSPIWDQLRFLHALMASKTYTRAAILEARCRLLTRLLEDYSFLDMDDEMRSEMVLAVPNHPLFPQPTQEIS